LAPEHPVVPSPFRPFFTYFYIFLPTSELSLIHNGRL
jgi:hypothetical protein